MQAFQYVFDRTPSLAYRPNEKGRRLAKLVLDGEAH